MVRDKYELNNLENPGVSFMTGGFVIAKKDKVETGLITERLAKLGYKGVGMIIPTEVGEFSFRGGVLDLWLERYKKPVRIDLFGNKIESIFLFEPTNGTKIKKLDEVYIVPYRSTPSRAGKWPRETNKDGRNKYERLFLSEVQPGDLVVHIDHGIGRFVGVELLNTPHAKKHVIASDSEAILKIATGRTGRYIPRNDTQVANLVIQYAKGDRLNVPINQIERVSHYVGSPGHRPNLNYLGTGAWERTKQRVQKSIVSIARELLQLYAVRETIKRPSYPTQSDWQQSLAESFPFEETPDQIQAIAEINADFSEDSPMDRILVGDVGFGKTEVALRAAFKVVESGKQVAVLTPTTLLAEQHYHLFKDRLKDFPVRLEFLSRFTTKVGVTKTLEGLKNGEVDMVVGTHRLLSKDVVFKRLGMLVIDEEHRFGVKQKEELKRKRLEVDVLSISATPIPRTLHMTLAKLRNVSVLATPPSNRLSVETHVGPMDWDMIKKALLVELNRGGQAYFVHNRIISLTDVAYRLAELVPELRVGHAHGQMGEKELESVMGDFYEGKIDCLVCTTIIGSGIDMPNVNTIFLDDSQRFGLADMHQLRGRVGRSDRQAFAYLFFPKGYTPVGEVYERLNTIGDFSELGAGFKLASRDLEIRGAGSLLGKEQHGFMNVVGFELYLRLLNQAVEMLKGGKTLRKI